MTFCKFKVKLVLHRVPRQPERERERNPVSKKGRKEEREEGRKDLKRKNVYPEIHIRIL